MDILEAEEILKNFIEYAELDNTESRAIETVLEELHTLRKQANSVFDRGYIHKDKLIKRIQEEKKKSVDRYWKERKEPYEDKNTYISIEKLKELLEEE